MSKSANPRIKVKITDLSTPSVISLGQTIGINHQPLKIIRTQRGGRNVRI